MTAIVPPASVMDLADNQNATTVFTRTYDITDPSVVSITRAGATPAYTASVDFTGLPL